MKRIHVLFILSILFLPSFINAQGIYDPSYHFGRHRIRRLLKEGFTIGGIEIDTIMVERISKLPRIKRPETREKYLIIGKKLSDSIIKRYDTTEKDVIITDASRNTAINCIKLYKGTNGKWSDTIIPSSRKWKYDTIFHLVPKNIRVNSKSQKTTVNTGDLLEYMTGVKVKKINRRKEYRKIIIFKHTKNASPDYQGSWAISSGTTSPMRFYELRKENSGLFRELNSIANDDSTDINYIYSNDSISFPINPNQFIKINQIGWFTSVINLFYRTTPACLSGYTISSPSPTALIIKYNNSPTINQKIDYRWQQIGTAGTFTSLFNLGPVVGLLWSNNCIGPQVNQSEFALSLGLGLPITVTQLSKEPVQASDSLKDPANYVASSLSNACISPCFVFGVSTHGIGAVITFGWNYMIGQYATDWIYDKHCYIGVGLGVSIGGSSSGGSSSSSPGH